MRFVDISNNNIVLRFLDNLIVTAGYKFNLEMFGIEGNEKEYKAKRKNAMCMPSISKNEKAFTYVSNAQIHNRNIRVNKNGDISTFFTTMMNIEKQRVRNGIY